MAAAGAPAAPVQFLSTAAEGLRLVEATFDRLAYVGERANNELVDA
jgi:hypothetical protein